jgi:hypothetical protein
MRDWHLVRTKIGSGVGGVAAITVFASGYVDNARALSTYPLAQHQQNRVDFLLPTVGPTLPKNGSDSIRGVEETNE